MRHVDEHRLTRRQIAPDLKAQRIERHRLGRQEEFGSLRRLVAADHQRPDTERIAKSQQTVAGDHRHHGVGALATAMHAGDGGENGVRVKANALGRLLQLVRQYVEQHFGIGTGVDMAQILPEHLFLQLRRVGQVAVVREHHAEGRIDVERLRFRRIGRRARRRIAAMGDTHVARQSAHVARAENVAHEAGALVHEKGVVLARGDAGRILSAMLQDHQPIVEQLVDRPVSHDSENTAHREFSYLKRIRLATSSGNQGLQASTAVSSGADR